MRRLIEFESVAADLPGGGDAKAVAGVALLVDDGTIAR